MRQDNSGYSVAIKDDAIAVRAPVESTGQGAVYVFSAVGSVPDGLPGCARREERERRIVTME